MESKRRVSEAAWVTTKYEAVTYSTSAGPGVSSSAMVSRSSLAAETPTIGDFHAWRLHERERVEKVPQFWRSNYDKMGGGSRKTNMVQAS